MLTRKDKDAIIFLSGCIGYLDNALDGYEALKINAQKAIEKVLKKIGDNTGYNDWDIEKLTGDIRKGKYKIEVVTQQDIKRRLNEQKERVVKLKLGELEDILENAMLNCTAECSRHKTKCPLRKAMLKIGVETLHNEKGKCEYKP